MNLESQVQEARTTITQHQCTVSSEEQPKACQPAMVDGYQQVKVANLENRTNSIEHSITLLTAKLENLQFIVLAANKTSEEETIEQNSTVPDIQKKFMCELCDFESTEKTLMKTHIESCVLPGSDNKLENSFGESSDCLACKQCSYKAIHTRDLKRHEAQMHCSDESLEVYSCKECEYSTQFESRLKKHASYKHMQQSRCFYSSFRRSETKSTNEDGKSVKSSGSFSNVPLTCQSCDYTTKSIEELRNHKSNHTKQNEQPRVKKNPTKPSRAYDEYETSRKGSCLNCDDCEKPFLHNDEYQLHMDFFHPRNEANQQ